MQWQRPNPGKIQGKGGTYHHCAPEVEMALEAGMLLHEHGVAIAASFFLRQQRTAYHTCSECTSL